MGVSHNGNIKLPFSLLCLVRESSRSKQKPSDFLLLFLYAHVGIVSLWLPSSLLVHENNNHFLLSFSLCRYSLTHTHHLPFGLIMLDHLLWTNKGHSLISSTSHEHSLSFLLSFLVCVTCKHTHTYIMLLDFVVGGGVQVNP